LKVFRTHVRTPLPSELVRAEEDRDERACFWINHVVNTFARLSLAVAVIPCLQSHEFLSQPSAVASLG